MSAGGKGDARRPQQIPEDEAQANWDRIFGKNKPAEPKEQDDA